MGIARALPYIALVASIPTKVAHARIFFPPVRRRWLVAVWRAADARGDAGPVARPGPGHLQQPTDERRQRRDRHRNAVPCRGCRHRAGDLADEAFVWRQPTGA